MGHKGFKDYKKQSSTVTANDALAELLAHDFEVARLDRPIVASEMKTAYRKDVLSAQRRFGADVDVSITGRSITLTNGRVDFLMPLSGMLGHGALEALEKIRLEYR